MAEELVTVAAATRNFPGEKVSGDAWQVDWSGEICRIAVVDGLGHGPAAAEAAGRAIAALAAHPELGPVEAIQTCHRALVGTRGAAMSVVSIDPGAMRLIFAGLGNVDAHLWLHRRQRLSADRGIVGSLLRTLHPITFDLTPNWFLAIHSDGISSRFEVTPPQLRTPAYLTALADQVLQRWARPTDDATIVVASP
ncbi:MAG TPA: SpoIIE family protein phosphatase [Chloroflexota bacterium]|nr:SpoIIE family protein phosphatase [Chloroflexota bacterium]